MASNQEINQHEVVLNTGKVSYLQGGSGPSLLWLHHSWGSPGALEVHQLLTNHFTVVIPEMPGWGGSDRPLWARTVRDIAALVGQFADQAIDTNYTLVGTGFGGYVASEMACFNPSKLHQLALIGAAGLQPTEGEIKDQMMLSHRQYIEESFRDRESYIQHFGEEPAQEMRDLWDHSREMTARVCWKPYMFNRRLDELLKNVQTPTRLIWGEEDTVVPPIVSDQFADRLPNSEQHLVKEAGHLVEIEQPNEIVEILKSVAPV